MKSLPRIAWGILALAAMLPGYAAAEYRSSSDTGVEVLDYIENRHREERANRLTGEQEQLIRDTGEQEQNLPGLLDPQQPMPVAFEGDDLTYDERTGEFVAKGHVDVIQMDRRRFQGEEVTGNVQEHVIRVPDKAHALQLPKGEVRVTLDGYRAVYNYGTKTGTMEDVSGKAGEYYVTGKRFEFYPDRVVIYDGTQTKCSAKNPDYHLSAEKIEIWPKDVMKMYNVKLWAGNTVIGRKKYHESDLKDKERREYPRVGYNKDHGAYIEQDIVHDFDDHFSGILRAHLETKHGIRSNGRLVYHNRNFKAQAVYGFFEDSDNVWIQKEPSLILDYGQRIGTLPLSYNLKYEIGHWRSNTTSSTHRYYEAGLTRDPIVFHNWLLFLHTSYTITQESTNSSTVRGMNYDAILGKDFDEKWAGFVGYHYNKNNSRNSVFDFDLDEYSKKVDAGLSYRMDRLNRFVVGIEYDTEGGRLKDVDYYWFRDLHCSQLILRYRAKRSKLEAHWEFTPW